jgi:hypothetical protein
MCTSNEVTTMNVLDFSHTIFYHQFVCLKNKLFGKIYLYSLVIKIVTFSKENWLNADLIQY